MLGRRSYARLAERGHEHSIAAANDPGEGLAHPLAKGWRAYLSF